MDPVDVYRTKELEYLLGIGYLLVFAALWRYLRGPASGGGGGH